MTKAVKECRSIFMIQAFVRRTARVCAAALGLHPIHPGRTDLLPAPWLASPENLLPGEAVLHDLDNLLSGIAVTAALAEAALPPEHTTRHDLTAIRRATVRGAELACQLRGRPVLAECRLVDLAILLGELEPILRAQLGTQIVYHVSLTAGLSPIIGDRAQLERVILNLVGNARKAMPEGGQLSLAVSNLGDSTGLRVRLTICDTGVGMDSATLARAFEPGFTTSVHSSGLGLAICAEIVRQHGGRIQLSSALAQGTTITVELPCAPGAADIAL